MALLSYFVAGLSLTDSIVVLVVGFTAHPIVSFIYSKVS